MKNKIYTIGVLIFVATAIIISCNLTNKKTEAANLATVKIGTQNWTVNNLSTCYYRNGDSIPQVQDTTAWENLTTGAWCYYNNNKDNDTVYGKLYNYYAVIDSRGLAPQGFHIPSDGEWTILTDFLGGEKEAGTKMKTTSGWENDSLKNGNGNNSSGFAGIPAGFRRYSGSFLKNGLTGIWWSKTEGNSNYSWSRFLSNANGFVNRHGDCKKKAGLSVRCLKD